MLKIILSIPVFINFSTFVIKIDSGMYITTLKQYKLLNLTYSEVLVADVAYTPVVLLE